MLVKKGWHFFTDLFQESITPEYDKYDIKIGPATSAEGVNHSEFTANPAARVLAIILPEPDMKPPAPARPNDH